MTGDQLLSLLPLMVLAVAAVVVLLSIAWRRSHAAAATIAVVGFGAAAALVPWAWDGEPRQVTALLLADGAYHFFTVLLCGAGLVCTLLAWGYLRGGGDEPERRAPEELYALLLLGTVGSVTLAGSVHLAAVFLGLEILSVSLYGLVAYPRDRRDALEAGIKYLVLAGASSAFFVLGVAFTYAASGSLDLDGLARLAGRAGGGDMLVAAGLGMIFVALGFKLALVPFHLWTPDVYQGAPAPVTAFVASVSKAGVFAVALRLLSRGSAAATLDTALVVVAVASMLLGNLLALLQDDLKRLLAYSSIAHLGYLLVALLAGGALGVEGAIYYLVAYLVTILTAFGVVSALSSQGREPRRLDSYRGLFWRRPGIAAILTVALLSLAGIPLTAGFLGKLYVLAAGVDASRWVLVLTLALTSAIGLFYYLRVVVTMLSAARGDEPELAPAGLMGGTLLTVLVVLLLCLGTAPSTLVDILRRMVAGS